MGKPQSVNMNTDSGQKTWLTPRRIVDALGPFDTDPCTPCFMPWRTATTMYNVFDDGTTAPWHGRVWLNPPYGREAVPFMRRMAEHPGGVSHSSSPAPRRNSGRSSSSRSHTPSSSSRDACASVTRTERRASPRPRRPHSSPIRRGMSPRWRTAA